MWLCFSTLCSTRASTSLFSFTTFFFYSFNLYMHRSTCSRTSSTHQTLFGIRCNELLCSQHSDAMLLLKRACLSFSSNAFYAKTCKPTRADKCFSLSIAPIYLFQLMVFFVALAKMNSAQGASKGKAHCAFFFDVAVFLFVTHNYLQT